MKKIVDRISICLFLLLFCFFRNIFSKTLSKIAKSYQKIIVNQENKKTLYGFVDMHTHPMAHLGFGGKVIHGAPDINTLMPAGNVCGSYVRPISREEALSGCKVTHSGWGLDNTCGDYIRKQVIRTMERENRAKTSHFEEGAIGYPIFNSWPAYNDITHQKMWIDWIRRAHKGGLRVIVALAVNNATLAATVMSSGDKNGDDVSLTDVQITEMKMMVNRHNDFMEIALTPTDLRAIVNRGKLAVILGVEIDNIGNFHKNANINPNNETTQSKNIIKTELQRLWNQGVRYVFPIHVIDNKFGGTAIYEDMFNLSNYHQTGKWWNIGCASELSGITHKFTVNGFDLPLSIVKAIKLGILSNPPAPPICPPSYIGGHVNKFGLTPLGKFAIKEMMKMGMMIDIDHMSERAADETLDIASALHDYPINSGHNGPRISNQNENGRTDSQYKKIAKLGGMIGLGHCGTASRFVKNYHYVLNLLVDSKKIAIGTDANGLTLMPEPDSAAKVVYDNTFQKTTVDNFRSWDINTDGMAHYGLLWDYVISWKSAGMAQEEYDSFFKTAEGFALMWEHVEDIKTKL